MTNEEQDAEIASMVRERRELLAKVRCLDAVLHRASEALNNARFVTDQARGEEYEAADKGVDYPAADKLLEHIADLRKVKERLQVLSAAIDGV